MGPTLGYILRPLAILLNKGVCFFASCIVKSFFIKLNDGFRLAFITNGCILCFSTPAQVKRSTSEERHVNTRREPHERAGKILPRDRKLKKWMRAGYLNYTRWVIPTLSFFTVVHYIEFWGPSDGENLRNFCNFLLTDSNGVYIFFFHLLKKRCLHEFPK